MKKICLIRQPAGIGDIFFCQKIAKTALSHYGYEEVIWPVINEFSYVNDYMGTENIKYVNEHTNFEYKDFYISRINTVIKNDNMMYLPLQYADQTAVYHDWRANGYKKYKLFFDLPHSDWKNFFEFRRNLDRENNLVKALNIDLKSKYNLVNRNYGSPPGNKIRHDIQPDNNYPNVVMELYQGTTIFDWISIILNAQEIYSMETALLYIIEKLGLKNVYVYSKFTWETNMAIDDFMYIRGNYSPEWHYVK